MPLYGRPEIIPIDKEITHSLTREVYNDKVPVSRSYDHNYAQPPPVVVREDQRFQIFNYVSPQRKYLPTRVIHRHRQPQQLAHITPQDMAEVYGLGSEIKIVQQDITFGNINTKGAKK